MSYGIRGLRIHLCGRNLVDNFSEKSQELQKAEDSVSSPCEHDARHEVVCFCCFKITCIFSLFTHVYKDLAFGAVYLVFIKEMWRISN